ncbi:unnamed protein product [Protopolystoma xenopodis]|uniref:Uncharacterized protein n=1 Tax=Protopolystoma xenopodis TaxID=117903 RepID=A0A3S5A4R0_9PLAT|nr:unnamed protein product [Protopolystoma xenopodis]
MAVDAVPTERVSRSRPDNTTSVKKVETQRDETWTMVQLLILSTNRSVICALSIRREGTIALLPLCRGPQHTRNGLEVVETRA